MTGDPIIRASAHQLSADLRDLAQARGVAVRLQDRDTVARLDALIERLTTELDRRRPRGQTTGNN